MNNNQIAFDTISHIVSEPLDISDDFMDIAARFSEMPGTVCLMSGGGLDCAQYHILAVKPWLFLYGSDDRMYLTGSGKKTSIKSNPFDILKKIVGQYKLPYHENLPKPLVSGLFGYLSYDLKDSIEKIQSTTINDLELPDIWFTAPEVILIKNRKTEKMTLHIPQFTKTGENRVNQTRSWFINRLQQRPEKRPFSGGESGFASNFTESAYKSAIGAIKEYIRSGDIYQVNMSQRFVTDFSGDAFSLFSSLYDANPAPFFAYLNCDDHQIVSTSPERFIRLDGEIVETRPIKGTSPRGNTPYEDEQLKTELKNSRKDDAELSMIVDLMRNDIGKVCRSGSVRVHEHKRVEAYQNVYHLVSVVKGILGTGYDAVDLIRAAFPGGSITGCPKIRSMEIIDELESNKRHIYTGSIGYIGFGNTMDLSIAIRTATILNDCLIFSVGGGVVYDSDPQSEYEETLHKGETLLNAFSSSEEMKKQEIAWENGLFRPFSDIAVPLSDPGFFHGYGFFETIRADKGIIHFLDEHLKRLKSAWEEFYSASYPNLSFETIIDNILEKNRLSDTTAAIKIITTAGGSTVPPFQNRIIITAKEYSHRLKESGKTGFDLVIYPHSRESNLADYKSLNYLFYARAGEFAKKAGADEAIILNPDGSISETNTCNLILIKGETILIPQSGHFLKGVTLAQLIKFYEEKNYTVQERRIYPYFLEETDQIILVNSLLGAVTCASVDELRFIPDNHHCEKLNRFLFQNKKG